MFSSLTFTLRPLSCNIAFFLASSLCSGERDLLGEAGSSAMGILGAFEHLVGKNPRGHAIMTSFALRSLSRFMASVRNFQHFLKVLWSSKILSIVKFGRQCSILCMNSNQYSDICCVKTRKMVSPSSNFFKISAF